MNLASPPGPELVDGIAAAFVDGGRSLQGNLQPLAQDLVGGMVLLQVTWFGIQALLESLGGENLGALLARLLRYVMLVGLAEWLLAAYDMVFFQGLHGGVGMVVTAVAGSNGEAQSFATAWTVFLDLMLSVWATLEAAPAHYLAGANPLQWQFWGAAFQLLLAGSMLFGSLVAFLLSLLVIAIVHVLGSALVGLGLALGPFFVPWLLWDAARSLFTGWLRFLFTASFFRVVAVTLLQLAKPVFLGLQQLVDSGADPGQARGALDVLMSAALLLVLSSVIAGLMAQVPQLASALMGHGRVGSGLFAGATRRLSHPFGRGRRSW